MSTELVWHGHHEAAYPFEVLKESFESRLATIMTVKAKDETSKQIKRRLQLFKKVQNPPVWLLEAMPKAYKASAEYDKASAEYDKAIAEYYKIILQNLHELMELHKTECGCGWTPENRNIFEYSEVADAK